MPDLNLTGIKQPKKTLSDEEVGKAYLESMIMLPAVMQAVVDKLEGLHEEIEECSAALSIISLYFEKKGLAEGIITSNDLDGDDGK